MTTATYTAAHISTLPGWVRLLLRASFAVVILLAADAVVSRVRGIAQGDDQPPASDETLDENSSDTPAATDGESSREDSTRLREGTNLAGELGTFKIAGDRALFVSAASGKSLIGLENLNLARIVNVVRDAPDSQWSVSGAITEYRGANYLLITKATRKTAQKPTVVRPVKLEKVETREF